MKLFIIFKPKKPIFLAPLTLSILMEEGVKLASYKTFSGILMYILCIVVLLVNTFSQLLN